MGRLKLLLAIPLLVALVAAGCSSDDDEGGGDASNAEEEQAGAIDPNGVLRVATTLREMDFELDELDGIGSVTQHGTLYYVAGTPLTIRPDGSIDTFLAEDWEVVDDSTVSLTLREGLTFQDGEPYNAQALADAMLRYQAHREQFPAVFRSWDLSLIGSIDVQSETELVFHLTRPQGGQFLTFLANEPGYVLSPNSTNANPIGAGPYRVTEFVAEDHLYLERWDDFFDADSYLLAGIEYTQVEDPQAAQNLFEAGDMDLIQASLRDIDALVGRDDSYRPLVTNNQGSYMLALCKSAPPFDDPEFREAFALAIDRNRLNEVVFDGNAEPMESFWNSGAAYAVPGLISPEADPDRSREILDEIGWDPKTTFPFGVFPGFPIHENLALTIQSMLQEVGIDAKVNVMEDFQYANDVNRETGGLMILANNQIDTAALSTPLNTAIASPWNPCTDDVADPELTDALAQLVAGSTDPADAWETAQRLVWENHYWIPLLTQPSSYVYNADRVQGLKEGTIGLTGATAPSPFLEGVSILAR
jgi:peptide/nickel transport system substrate-binding protein